MFVSPCTTALDGSLGVKTSSAPLSSPPTFPPRLVSEQVGVEIRYPECTRAFQDQPFVDCVLPEGEMTGAGVCFARDLLSARHVERVDNGVIVPCRPSFRLA